MQGVLSKRTVIHSPALSAAVPLHMFPQRRAEPCTRYRDTPAAAMMARWTLAVCGAARYSAA